MGSQRRALAQRIPCTQCDKTFSKTEHLNRHRLVHSGERPYKCCICFKQYARRDVLLRHRRNHPSDGSPRRDEFSLPSTDPFEELSLGEAHGTGMDGRDEILILPAREQDTFGTDTRPLINSHQLSATKEVQGHGSPHDLTGDDQSKEFLNLLFNSSYESLTPLDSLVNQRIMRPNDQAGLQSPQLHSVFGNGSTSHPDVADQLAMGARSLWPGGTPRKNRPDFWHEIAFGSSGNIYDTYNPVLGLDASNQTLIDDSSPEVILTNNCKRRLGELKKDAFVCECNQVFENGSVCGRRYCCMNTTEVFDQGLHLYTHKYQPAYPILHLATFSPDKTSALLLFVICMIGVSFLKTEEAAAFVQNSYPVIIRQVYSKVVFTSLYSQKPVEILGDLVLAHHTLFLFISTGGNLCLEESKALYMHTLTAAQQRGFFSSKLEEPQNALSPQEMSENARWRAWSRVESTKCLIIGLLLHDAWLSELSSMSPIIQAHALTINLPPSNNLYEAPDCHAWSQLLTNTSNNDNVLELLPQTFSLPDLNGPMHTFSMYGLLCSVLLRVNADMCRLVSNSDIVPASQHLHVPWRILQIDQRASIAVPLITSLISLYDETLRRSNPNCIVIWHSVCILLTVDTNILARAAGREGPEQMSQARIDLSIWVNTTAARRACLHAAQTFRTLLHRKPADGTAFQSVRTLFMSALVLGMYILLGPDHPRPGRSDSSQFDLANTELDWHAIDNTGFFDPISNSLAKLGEQEDPGIKFIRDGGPIVIDGIVYERGSRHAQRIILEFASLLDEVGTHWMADYARLLYMIHDTMVEPTVTP